MNIFLSFLLFSPSSVWHPSLTPEEDSIPDKSRLPDFGSLDSLPDHQLVEKVLAPSPLSSDSLHQYILNEGFTPPSTSFSSLLPLAASIIRIKTKLAVPSISSNQLKKFLQLRELDSEGTKDELLLIASNHLRYEQYVVKALHKPVHELSEAELLAALGDLGFVGLDGSIPELVAVLGRAYADKEVVESLGKSTLEPQNIKQRLRDRGLSIKGSAGVLLSRLASSYSSTSSDNECDMTLSSALCVSSGLQVVATPSSMRSNILHLNFDTYPITDSSGMQNHPLSSTFIFANGLPPRGSSLSLDGSKFLQVMNSASFDSPNFSISFWIYLRGDSTGAWRTLLHKGSVDSQRGPAILLEPQTRGLEVFLNTTSNEDYSRGERVWSASFIPLRKWTHVAVTVEARRVSVFINGVLDAQNTTVGVPQMNSGPLYIGSVPWKVEGGVDCLIDELNYYTTTLAVDEIQAQTQLALGGVDAPFVQMGCMGCTLDSCLTVCRRGYHTCTQRDLFSGAYLHARSMQWANSQTRVWTAEDQREGADSPSPTGLCVCCHDSK